MLLISACHHAGETGFGKADTTYYSKGKIRSIEKYYPDDTSKVIEYYENGEISSEATYYKDQMTGRAIFYYLNGAKNFEQHLDSLGRSHGAFHWWYQNGNLKREGNYKEGNMVGEWKTYFEDGKLKRIERYDSDQKNGRWLYFNPQGDTVKIEIYRNDSLVNTR
jgi:antitoxin component YwqK of YwqJK toxin-antitoxin module